MTTMAQEIADSYLPTNLRQKTDNLNKRQTSSKLF